MNTDACTAPSASLAENMAQLVPAHAHIVIRDPSDHSSWTWSTPAGLWAVYAGPGRGVCGAPGITVSGPGGMWTLPANTETPIEQLKGLLQALGAINEVCGAQ